MPNAIDQVNDDADGNDQSSPELKEEAGAELSNLSSADNRAIIDFHRRSQGAGSAGLHHVETTSDSPSTTSDTKTDTAPTREDRTDRSLRERKDVTYSDVVKDKAQQDALEKGIQERLALQLKAELELSGAGGSTVESAKERLISLGSSDLPDDISERIDDWVDFQRRQRAGTEEAAELGLTDDDGNPLVFPGAESDEDLAETLNNFADAYEKNERGELTGTAAEGFGGSSGGQRFVDDWNSSLALILDPIGEDDQAQIGSCTMNSEGLYLNNADPRTMSKAYCDALTTGQFETGSGEVVNVFADELGRGGKSHNAGQSAGIFLMCSLLSSAAYGDKPSENDMHHRTGNALESMDYAGQVLTGRCISDRDSGAKHKLSPGHSMMAFNIVHSDGSATSEQFNHWNQMGANEPGEGTDFRFKHQFDLARVLYS